MRAVDLDAMHATQFSEYANIGVASPEYGEFIVGMDFAFKESVILAVKKYTITRGVDYA
ncbi:hypothetical protein PIB30_104455, partial [Stylosanthes scabra]|nr:hypothetical protein [Stylosanthes scabra]